MRKVYHAVEPLCSLSLLLAEVAELADLPADLSAEAEDAKVRVLCHGGGTGRRARLKIVFPQGSESSILSRGTKTTSARPPG